MSPDHLRSSPDIRAAAVRALETLDAEIESLETTLVRESSAASSDLAQTIEELSALWLSLSEATAEIDLAFDDEEQPEN